MGAWGVLGFENDKALDWVYELGKKDDTSEIIRALKKVTDLPADEYMDDRYCTEAIAASEIIAAMNGKPLSYLPDSVKDWLEKHPGLYTPELVAIALPALDRITTESETKELWDDSKHAKEWYAAMDDLRARLKA